MIGPEPVSFVLNGITVSCRGDHPHLLAALREELSVLSPKDGCSPSGQCGCCTVLLDGKAQVSCQTSLAKATGREVTTLEGISTEERDRYARVFASTGALQCGFCTPGIVMDPWSLAFTTDVRAVDVEIDGEVVLRDGIATRVDPVEVRAKAAEQAERLHRLL